MNRAYKHAASWILASGILCAGPITISQINTAPSFQNPVVGEFQLQQSGNEITGSFQLNQTPPDDMNEYLIVRPSDNTSVGDFVLQETGNEISGNFVLEQTSSPSSSTQQTDYNALLMTNLSAACPTS